MFVVSYSIHFLVHPCSIPVIGLFVELEVKSNSNALC